MKYFTPNLIDRAGSLDDDVAYAADKEWELALVRYQQRLEKILKALPESVRRFEARQVCLHDSKVVSMGRQGDLFLMVLELEPPAQRIAVLTFTLVAEPEINPRVLPGGPDSTSAEWLYEEWDLDRRKRYSFEVLLSNGWSVKLRFSAFDFQIVQKILPTVNGQPAQSANATVPRSA